HLDTRGRSPARLLSSGHLQRLQGRARRAGHTDGVVEPHRGPGHPHPEGPRAGGQHRSRRRGRRAQPSLRHPEPPRGGEGEGFRRSVGWSENAFITESFIDELAHVAGKDPYEYRRALLGKAKRHKTVLETAATKANWGAPLPAGRARGIAVAFSYGSYVAHVAEVSVTPDGHIRVHKLVCAIDCGIAVNPDQVRAQMEGGAVYAMTGMYDQITIEKGRVQQSNFHDYPLLRIAEAPVVETHIVDSGEAPGGLGEPGVPSVAPSICNAVFVLTGKRIRTLPIRPEDLKKA